MLQFGFVAPLAVESLDVVLDGEVVVYKKLTPTETRFVEYQKKHPNAELRYWERETLKLPEDQIEERHEHLRASVEQLRAAYLTFSDLDL